MLRNFTLGRFSPCASVLTVLSVFAFAAHAQQPMGTVPTHDALVTGGLEVHGEQASLLTNASITAYDHSATITLARGGEALVCATSQFHLLHSGQGPSLLFGLDRGAIELRSPTQPQDVILTPDIRFTLESNGQLDLRLRVTPSGDTCVENAGPQAPTLTLSASFDSATYRLLPGQHVLFEHGNLHEVVDHERSPCGCPAEPTVPATAAEGAHPFPAAASVGLTPATTVPTAPKTADIASTISYSSGASPGTPETVAPPPPPAPTPAPQTIATTPPPSPPGAHAILHSIGHFFHRLFHGKEAQQPSQIN